MSRINIRQRTWKVEIVAGAKKEVYVQGDTIPEGKSVGDVNPERSGGTIWSTPTKDGNRKMLQVQFPKRSGRKVNGKLVPPPRFYVDIPKHFF